MNGDLAKIEEGMMGTVARLLIDHLTAPVNSSREGSFIGIPLQCHILADCFQSHLCEFLSAQERISRRGIVVSSDRIDNQFKYDGELFTLVTHDEHTNEPSGTGRRRYT